MLKNSEIVNLFSYLPNELSKSTVSPSGLPSTKLAALAVLMALEGWKLLKPLMACAIWNNIWKGLL